MNIEGWVTECHICCTLHGLVCFEFWRTKRGEKGRSVCTLGTSGNFVFCGLPSINAKQHANMKTNHLLLYLWVYLLKYTGHLIESVRNNKNIPLYKEKLRFIVPVFSILFFHSEYTTLLCCWQSILHFAVEKPLLSRKIFPV